MLMLIQLEILLQPHFMVKSRGKRGTKTFLPFSCYPSIALALLFRAIPLQASQREKDKGHYWTPANVFLSHFKNVNAHI